MKRVGKLTICGLAWTVHEGVPTDHNTLGTTYGYCDHTRQEIWLREGMSTSMSRDTLRHEVLHALLEHSGAEEFLKGVLRNSADVDAVVETLVRILTPHLSALTLAEKLQP